MDNDFEKNSNIYDPKITTFLDIASIDRFMSAGIDPYGPSIEEWCNNEEFIKSKKPEELSQLLSKSSITSHQFRKIFTIIHKNFKQEDTISISKNVSLCNIHDQKSAKKVLDLSSLFVLIAMISLDML